MTMNVKNGFSTLNRLLGKKNKGNNLSKSSSEINNLTRNIDSIAISSHLEQNRITPLPIATANAPFEQTFRITVLLPRDQLYVARLGAKTKLEKLLELICENKQLDPEKYEFRHPIDTSQVFSNELTIGAVGLTEIRLCHISETYDNFNADEIIKLRHTGRGSMSSSEFSSKNSKHTLKTASPYSSTNSLNSIDSTGMSTNYRGPMVTLPSAHNHQQQNCVHLNGNSNGHKGKEHSSTSVKLLLKEGSMNRIKIIDPVNNGGKPNAPIVPTRKKRVAPRPPSRGSIPEGDIISSSSSMNISAPVDDENRKHPDEVFASKYGNGNDCSSPKKDFHVSTPNLSSSNAAELSSILKSSNFHQSNISIDCKNSRNIHEENSKLNRVSTRSDINENCSNLSTSDHVNKIDVVEFKKPYPKMKTISMYNLNRPASMSASEIDVNEINTMRRNSCSNASEIPNGNHSEGLTLPEPAPRKKVLPIKKKAPAPPPRSLPPPIASPRNTNASQVDTEILLKKDNTGSNNGLESDYTTLNGESRELKSNNSDLSITVTVRNDEKNKDVINVYEEKQISISSEALPKLNQSQPENSIVLNTKQSQQLVENCAQSSYTTVTCTANNEQKTISRSSITESSSDDEEQMKIYNITLGKTIVKKPVQEDKTAETLDNLKSTHTDNTINQSISNNTISPETTSSTHSSPSILSTSTSQLSSVSSTPIYSPISIENNTVQHNNKQRTKIILNDNKSTGDNSSISMTTITMVELFQNTPNGETLSSAVSSSSTSPLPVNCGFEKENDISENVITSDIEDGYRGNKITDEGIHKSGKEPKKEDEMVKNENIQESVDSCHTNYTLSPILVNSYDSSKSEVLTELNHVINENKIETVIKKSSSDEEGSNEIESPKPSCLSNFKISTYSPSNASVSTTASIDEDSFKSYEETNGDIKCDNDKNEVFHELITSKTVNTNSISVSKSESLKSATQLKKIDNEVKRNGFSVEENHLMENNNCSYLSLQNVNSEEYKEEKMNGAEEVSTVRRNSSSRLGIEESIDLQSLIVMKTILNSRKGDSIPINENNISFENELNNYKNLSAASDEKNIQENMNVQDDCDSSKENSPKNKLLSKDITKVERPEKKMTTIDKAVATIEKSLENEKKWKYQGPPSINVSTWSERPKVQVSIKDDSDYIFGGNVNKRNISKFSKEGEYKRESSETVKSPQYPIKIQSNPITKSSQQQQLEKSKVPFVRGVEYKKSVSQTGEVDCEDHPIVTCSNTMTLGRLPKTNKMNIQPTVKGFKSIENFSSNKELNNKTIAQNDEVKLLRNSWKSPLPLDSNSNESKTNENNNKFSSLERNNSMNSSSVNCNDNNRLSLQQNNPFCGGNLKTVNNKRFSVNGIEERFMKSDSDTVTPPPPFFQVNLRKTGLKEKIISSAMEADNTPTKRNVPNTERNNEQSSAKLELKLVTHKNSISLEKGNSNQWISSHSRIEEKPIQPSKIYIQNSSEKLKKEPTVNGNTKQNGTLVAPPPPPPPVIRSVVTKQNSTSSARQQNGTTATTPEDNRNELLSAIRNFNRTSLKHKT